MNGQAVERSCDDIDSTALSFAELKALSAGDPRIKEKMDLDIEVLRLKLLKTNYESERYALEDNIYKYFPKKIQATEERIAQMSRDWDTIRANAFPDKDSFAIEVDTTLYTDKKEGAEKLLERITAIDIKAEKPELVGKYRGFPLKAGFNGFLQEYEVLLCGQREYKIKMGGDAAGNITRLNNALSKIPEYLTEEKAELQNLSAQIERGKEELKKPFEKEEELREKSERLIELNALLKLDEKTPEVIAEQGEQSAETQPKKELCGMER